MRMYLDYSEGRV